MKKSLVVISSIVFAFLLIACGQKDKESTIEPEKEPLVTQETTRFTNDEIDAAMECVREEFKNFEGCKLTDLWYDEKESMAITESYMQYGRGSTNGVAEENIIVLISNFDVDKSGGDGSLTPGTTYDNWSWTLIRDDKAGQWKVDDYGY